MGATKTTEFSLKENKLAKYAKALAHPARVSILNLLASKHTCVCGDIVDELPLSQSTVSQHLKELKEAGLYYASKKQAWYYRSADLKEFRGGKKNLDEIRAKYGSEEIKTSDAKGSRHFIPS